MGRSYDDGGDVGMGGGGESRRFSRFAWCAGITPPLSFALRTKVARSGLLEVPGDRYRERRFVFRSTSSASKNTSCEEDEEPSALVEVDGPAIGEGVAGMTVGVDG